MRNLVESLESRQHLSITHLLAERKPPQPKSNPNFIPAATTVNLKPAATVRARPAEGTAENLLTSQQVSQILAQAASQARPGQAVALSDREGNILGVYATTTATQSTIDAAMARARTGGYFQSTQNAFTTRTARFIIQDNFPWPVRNTPGGPLYGVQFSTFPGSDIVAAAQTPGVSADPGGVPIYLNGNRPVGGLGVAGDGNDVAPRANLALPGQKVFNGFEVADFDESVALAGATGRAAPTNVRINAMPNESIRSTKIFLPGPGLRFPFTASPIAKGQPFRTLDQLVAAGLGTIVVAPTATTPNPYPKVPAAVYGIAGELKNTTVPGFGIVGSDDPVPDDQKLTADDVNVIIRDAVQQALKDRAAIRLPIGVPVIIHVAVTDRDGDVLGVFRMNDGTNFSFDVAVQKARTAAFFSDDTHAFSTRAIGFMSQRYFASGITPGGTTGPLFELQNQLTATPGNLGTGPVANGITIFPGGVPLYKNGVLVGGIGVSGDGVEQDDRVAFFGGKRFQPPVNEIRSDYLQRGDTVNHIVSKVQTLQSLYTLSTDFAQQARTRFAAGFNFRLPYVKFARNPGI